MNEAKALNLLKSGDQEALEWFIDRYSAYVGTVVSNILKDSMSHEDIEEVTADVFVTLWSSAANLYPLNIKGYLSRVARSLSMQKLRDKVSELPLDEDILILDDDTEFERGQESGLFHDAAGQRDLLTVLLLLPECIGDRKTNADESIHGQDQA